MKTSVIERIRALWNPPPDWLEALAKEIDATSFNAAAKRVGYSPAVLHGVINGNYPGDVGGVEKAVRGALMAFMVDCPVDGEIAADVCSRNQRRRLTTTNPRRIRLYRHCHGAGAVPKCPHSRIGGGT